MIHNKNDDNKSKDLDSVREGGSERSYVPNAIATNQGPFSGTQVDFYFQNLNNGQGRQGYMKTDSVQC